MKIVFHAAKQMTYHHHVFVQHKEKEDKLAATVSQIGKRMENGEHSEII